MCSFSFFRCKYWHVSRVNALSQNNAPCLLMRHVLRNYISWLRPAHLWSLINDIGHVTLPLLQKIKRWLKLWFLVSILVYLTLTYNPAKYGQCTFLKMFLKRHQANVPNKYWNHMSTLISITQTMAKWPHTCPNLHWVVEQGMSLGC